MKTRPEPFTITVPQSRLDDLKSRLDATRWYDDPGNADGHYGLPTSTLRPLVEYWADGFDWRAQEARLNAYEHYRVAVDGVPIHYLHRPGVGPDPTPLILTHGWPWTFWHWSKVIDALADPAAHGGDAADAFDVIVPSLPGFGFSSPLSAPDLNFWKVADLWDRLMTQVLGFPRYAAAGCDVGALVTGQLGHKYPHHLEGIHIGSGQKLTLFNGDRAWDLSGGNPLPENLPPDIYRQVLDIERRFAVHLAAQVLAPSTLAHALSDSPAGMLAWILERWTAWSDNHGDVESVFSRDDLLTHATIYWVTDTIGSSMRIYANNNRYPWQPSNDTQPVVDVPTGLTLVGYENPPGVTTPEQREENYRASDRAGWYNLTNLTAHPHGGHFIPWEAPDAWVGDLRRTFRPESGPSR